MICSSITAQKRMEFHICQNLFREIGVRDTPFHSTEEMYNAAKHLRQFNFDVWSDKWKGREGRKKEIDRK